jgi:hypothetical protein
VRTSVLVEVEMLEALPSGQRSRARAAARMGFATGWCRLSPSPADLLAAYEATSQAAQAAEAARDAAEQAAADAAAAYKEAVNSAPEEAEALQDAAEQAAEAAEDAADEARAAQDAVPVEDAGVRADCGSGQLDLVLTLPAGQLRFERVTNGSLRKHLEPRLVSTRADEL